MSKANYTFSTMPSVSISRSKFVRSSQHKTSIQLGDIVPIYWDDVLPGDTWSFDMASFIRMNTPVVPIMDNIVMDIYAFYVPKRLVWEHFREFFGENNAGAGIPVSSYHYPQLLSDGSNGDDYVYSGSLLDYLGLPVVGDFANVMTYNHISCLPLRAYYAIYNRWFRNQNIIAPIPVNLSDNAGALVAGAYASASSGGTSEDCVLMPLKASKLPDYFTKALPYAQKGAAVTIPLGTTAPIIAGTLHDVDGVVKFETSGGTGGAMPSTTNVLALAGSSAGTDKGSMGLTSTTGTFSSSGNFITKTNLVADLSSATAATINQLRYAFQLQKLLEKDALYGSRFWELLASHFGVTAPDASLQDPEYLGGKRIHINIDQVLATAAGTNSGSGSVLGQTGANSVSGLGSSNLFAKSFVEPGIIMVMAVARHEQTYDQGIDRLLMHYDRYDDYYPVFANLGAQDIKKGEIYTQGSAVDGQVFGYQEAWAEYRYKRSIVTGQLRPGAGPYAPWTLATRFGALPTLGQTFIEQDRNSIKDSLLSGANGPDFICDFAFTPVVVRPMPTYSIPGLIDHH